MNIQQSSMSLHSLLCILVSLLFCVNPFKILVVSFLTTHDSNMLDIQRNETDRLALMHFKSLITHDPLGALNSWNDSLHFCQWQGITCSNRHQRVSVIDLQSQKLMGKISLFIGNLTFIKVIYLQNNSFSGEIPPEVGRLFRMQELNLGNNSLGGEIPANLTHCSELTRLRLDYNGLVGNVPSNFGSMSKLILLVLQANNLTGDIPPFIGNLSSLQVLALALNSLRGSIPDAIGQLKSLTFIGLGVNNLIGMIPPSLFNLSSLNVFAVANNRLYGNLPWDIGATLPNLQHFYFTSNQFSGFIPPSFSNASGLQKFEILSNKFSGPVPRNLGNLWGLQRLYLGDNNLGYGGTDDLNFLPPLSNCTNLQILGISYNNFGGVLPSSIGNLSIQLTGFYLGGNEIFGSIPMEIGTLVNLNLLGMEKNLFTGKIPESLGKLHRLQGLVLANNKLSGEIPYSLRNLTQLITLYLYDNHLNGSIPSYLESYQQLEVLDLSQNKFSGTIPGKVFRISALSISLNLSHNVLIGSLPSEVGNLKSLGVLDISENKLSGSIPSTLGDCVALEHLHMEGNFFNGSIPSSLGSLKGICYLDLSHNNLSGKIPQDIQNLVYLQSLNLSFNNLEGEVPILGVFQNASAISVVGNKELCGGISSMELPRCQTYASRTHGMTLVVKVILVVAGVTLCLVLTILLLVFYLTKKSRKKSSPSFAMGDLHLRVSYEELFKGTNGFALDNLIGSGSFGSVYKGELHQNGTLVAVKVIDLQQKGASKSFMVECEALRKIRHRNLLKILTSCSSIDFKGNDFKALVFEFMPNGSLENFLHLSMNEHQSRCLSFTQRLNIVIDVACALDYLHHHSETPIVHCDLKPSNILLDGEMTAHVGDFGLAKFLSVTTSNFNYSGSSSIAVKGSIGYIAPEYGMEPRVSTAGDVYSFGILLLEMFTGKRPDDAMFENGLSLHYYTKTALPKKVVEITDPSLLLEWEGNYADEYADVRHEMHDFLISLLNIGVACSAEFPGDRMDIANVVTELCSIRKRYQRNERNDR